MKNKKGLLFETNTQQVLSLLLDHPGEEFLEQDVQKRTRISKSGTNYALRHLAQAGFINRRRKGKMYICDLCRKDAVVKQLKVLKTILSLEPALNKLKDLCRQVILFGSCAAGDNVSDSDIDLFLVTNHLQDSIEKALGTPWKGKIQLILRTPAGEADLKHKDPVFYEQIKRGIVLWESE